MGWMDGLVGSLPKREWIEWIIWSGRARSKPNVVSFRAGRFGLHVVIG